MRTPVPLPLLTAADECLLARRIEAGVLAEHLLACGERPLTATAAELAELVEAGRRAWHDFLLANLRLVGKLAVHQARRSGLPTDDLFQEGFVAMAGALQRFDPDRGRFSTFATVRIRQRLAEVTASRLGALELPDSRALRLRRARGLETALVQEHGRSVATAELAAALGRPVGWTQTLLGHQAPMTIDYTADENMFGSAQPADPDRAIYARQFRRVLRGIDADQARVVALRYGLVTGDPLDVTEIARRLGVSDSTVRRLEVRGLAALRGLADRFDPVADNPLAG
ncbi:MAG: sigma-70 family RNA polymerase sigma factor [Propionicimonas sp.]